jgi:uncharacterized membrane protein YdjX (TVP38/TMEM64 family)
MCLPRPDVDVGATRRDLAAMNKDRRDLQYRLIILTAALVVILVFGSWLVWTDAAIYQWLFRLYNDHDFMRAMLERWGIFAPLAFILIQALQVVIAPIPGDVTGLLGGFVFGQRLGFIYSSVGLTIGSLFAFWLGRRLGAPFVKRMTGPKVWQRLDFIVEAEGAILCFIIFLVPGLPKDTLCYLFGVSPLPFWVFALVSTLGRMPGTWVLSAGGARVAGAEYTQLLLLSAVVTALALPVYYYRSRIVNWLRRRV